MSISSNSQGRTSSGVILQKSPKLTNEKRSIPPARIKEFRQIFNSLGASQLMPVERLSDALTTLGYDTRKDLRYEEFLVDYELFDGNETSSSGLLDFEHFVLLILHYEDKLRLENDALRHLDSKIAFEYFDMNKDGMIDVDELASRMNTLGFPVTEREAKEMIDFADQDKDSLLSFEEFITVLAQISAMNTEDNFNTSSNQRIHF